MSYLGRVCLFGALIQTGCLLTLDTPHYRAASDASADASDRVVDVSSDDSSSSADVTEVVDVTDAHLLTDAMEVVVSDTGPIMETHAFDARIEYIHDTYPPTLDYYVRLTYPSWADAGAPTWSTGHCVGGVRTLGDPRNTDACTLDYTRLPVGTLVEFYPILMDLNPVCDCNSGAFCPPRYTTDRFAVYLNAGALVYQIGAGLSQTCETVPSGMARVISFLSP